MKVDVASGPASPQSPDWPAFPPRADLRPTDLRPDPQRQASSSTPATKPATKPATDPAIDSSADAPPDAHPDSRPDAQARARDAREADLLRRAHAGDRAAFGAFVLSSQDRLYTVLLRILGDREEAREICQETYLKALQGLPSFRGSSAPYTWLYRIAVNLAIGRLRKVRRRRAFSLDSDAATSRGPIAPETPQSVVLGRERAGQVLSALGRLDAEYRAVLVMRDVDDLDYREIADILELPLGTVKSRIFRARLALRDELQKYFGTSPVPPASTSTSTPTPTPTPGQPPAAIGERGGA